MGGVARLLLGSAALVRIAAQCWRVALAAAHPGSGFLPLSVGEFARRGEVPPLAVMPALDLLARLGVLLSCPALPGGVPFKVNLDDPPSWAVEGAVWPSPPRLRELLASQAAG